MRERPDISDYEFVTRCVDGRYYLFIDELSLIARGESLEEAYGDLKAKVESLFDSYGEANLFDRLPLPASHIGLNKVRRKASDSSTRNRSGGGFFNKAIGAILIVILMVGLGGITGRYVIMGGISAVKTELGFAKQEVALRPLLAKAAAALSSLADLEISARREQEVTNDIRKVVALLKPYRDEIVPLFTVPTDSTSPNRPTKAD